MTKDLPSSVGRIQSTLEGKEAILRVKNVSVRNFRLLREVDVDLSESTTVLVGRNNTGKTSLAEVLTRFLQQANLKFTIADFSSGTYGQFRRACELYLSGNEEDARRELPAITLTITIAYDAHLPEYGPLSPLIIDLDPECTEAIVRFTYALEGGRLKDLFEGLTERDLSTETVLEAIDGRIPELFQRMIVAVDPTDELNTREMSLDAVRELITVDFLQAQRGLDDEKERPKDLIGKILQSLFTAASRAEDSTAQKRTVEELEVAVQEIESNLGLKVSDMVDGIVPTLENFGYPGLHGQEIEAKTKLDTERLLSNYTSVHYRGAAGVSLPESYSGLGSRNLIFILLTLLSYYREYAARGNVPGVHLVFVEEPEAHLHPQMQEVFIEQLANLVNLLPKSDGVEYNWPVQFLISTHSSHVANRASFSDVRYFRTNGNQASNNETQADVLDLSRAPDLDVNFLHQYLTLTRSDLFFADKAILVEGTSERLIIPAAIEKSAARLSSQYVTLLEVGGAFAHIFFPLLDFLGLPSLIITDIDSIGFPDKDGNRKAMRVSGGDRTSNATIKEWFSNPEISPGELLKSAEKEAVSKGNRCIAYQVPEAGNGACGRSFEDAFILANAELFGLSLTENAAEDEEKADQEAKKHKKSDFALQFAIRDTEWTTPRYIQRGLDWILNYQNPLNEEKENAGEGVVVK